VTCVKKLLEIERLALTAKPGLVSEELWPKLGRAQAIRNARALELGNCDFVETEYDMHRAADSRIRRAGSTA
jgi:hypothetical protein